MKFGQSIREEGPETHQKKAGTPTMGGPYLSSSSIIISTLALSYIYGVLTTQTIVLLLVLVGFGANRIFR